MVTITLLKLNDVNFREIDDCQITFITSFEFR